MWGRLALERYGSDDAFLVTVFQAGSTGARVPVTLATIPKDLIRTHDGEYLGTWHRATAEAHWNHWSLLTRVDTAIPFAALQHLVPTVTRPSGSTSLVITYAPDVLDLATPNPLQEFAAWHVTHDTATPFDLACEPETYGIGQISDHWPVELLAGKRVLVVGLGSIGGIVASSLAAYGIGHLDLLDPDRLLWHNLVRHVLPASQVGRFKVEALRDVLRARWPLLTAVSHVADVVGNADLVRGFLSDVDAVVCAADGIAPRRVVSHLARRAGTDAILTSVLEDGAYGEVLRLRRAPDAGCLLCRRALMYEEGQMDPERVQERGYGDGDPHRPMTAVGPDLSLVGNLAAKVTAASLLDRHGIPGQRLPGEQAIIGLRPLHGYEPPFDITRAADLVWHPATPPRPECLTCHPA